MFYPFLAQNFSSENLLERLNKKMNSIFGSRIKVETLIVKKINKTKIGKHRYLDQRLNIN